MWWLVILALLVAALVGVAVYDLVQRKHAILRNFPVIGHLRFILEGIGPEVRQYIVTDNDQERPFSRDQRRWVYTSSKAKNTYFGFGTDNNLDVAENYLVIKQAAFPVSAPSGEPGHPDPDRLLPCAKVVGAAHQRRLAFRPLFGILSMTRDSNDASSVSRPRAFMIMRVVCSQSASGWLAPAIRPWRRAAAASSRFRALFC